MCILAPQQRSRYRLIIRLWQVSLRQIRFSALTRAQIPQVLVFQQERHPARRQITFTLRSGRTAVHARHWRIWRVTKWRARTSMSMKLNNAMNTLAEDWPVVTIE
jgi:hypothetical protein